jgi:hypothetical protein
MHQSCIFASSHPHISLSYLCGSQLGRHRAHSALPVFVHGQFADAVSTWSSPCRKLRGTALESVVNSDPQTDQSPTLPIAAQAQVGGSCSRHATTGLHPTWKPACRCCGEQCIESGYTGSEKLLASSFQLLVASFGFLVFPGCVCVWPLFLWHQSLGPSNLLHWDVYFPFEFINGVVSSMVDVSGHLGQDYQPIHSLACGSTKRAGPFGLTGIGIQQNKLKKRSKFRVDGDRKLAPDCIHKTSSPFFFPVRSRVYLTDASR